MALEKNNVLQLQLIEAFDDMEYQQYSWTSDMIGPEGGHLTISDIESPLYGTVLKIPAGALDTPTMIQIREGNHSGTFGIGPSVQLLPEGLEFKRPVELKIYHKRTNKMMTLSKEEPDLALYYFDDNNRQWVYGCLAATDVQENGTVCHLYQF
jgi:hypothetical protein